MFAKFNLKLSNDDLKGDNEYRVYGLGQYADQKQIVRSKLDKYLKNDGFLDSSEIKHDWFPEVNTQVFLSHSHQDEEVVLRFAGYLFKNYGITNFIDSAVWGYANDLLKQIDNEYCVQSKKLNGGYTYDYDKRNQSTAHVHMLLHGALAKMINRCETLIFINTPRSILTSDIEKSALTASPWIYSELLMANTFPAREPEYYEILKAEQSDIIHEYAELKVKYKVGLKNFVDIDLSDIHGAGTKVRHKNGRAVLDQLYLDKGLMVNNTIKE